MSLIFTPKYKWHVKRTLNKAPVNKSELDMFVRLRALNVPYQQIVELMGRSTSIWSLAAERYGVVELIQERRNKLIINGIRDPL